MNIGLASYRFINKDINYNISQIEKACEQAKDIDIIFFGEAFLQGFDGFCFKYEEDKDVAIEIDSDEINYIASLAKKYSVDLGFGYLEKEGDALYSSYVIIIDGKVKYNYRRISKGWKENFADFHYKEGNRVLSFDYKNRNMTISLCGDLWDYTSLFKTKDILIWPVYLNYSALEWSDAKKEYALNAYRASSTCLMINSISDEPLSLGGAYLFKDGEIVLETKALEERVLKVHL